MSRLFVKWYASEALRRSEVVEDGRAGTVIREFSLPMHEQPRAWREQVAGLLTIGQVGSYTADLTKEWTEVRLGGSYSAFDQDYAAGMYRNPLSLDAQPTATELPGLIERVVASAARRRRLSDENLAAKQAAEEAALERRKVENAERAARDAEAQARREDEKAARAAEKGRWIDASGSKHLQRAFAAGYNCQRQYVVERAATEWPGWVVDFNDTARWSERPFPGEEALDVADEATQGVQDAAEAHQYGMPVVVWLTTEPSDDISDNDDDGEYEVEPEGFGQEAVLVEGFLTRYNLVKII